LKEYSREYLGEGWTQNCEDSAYGLGRRRNYLCCAWTWWDGVIVESSGGERR